MNVDNIDFFNVGELVPVGGTGGMRLNRFPSRLEGEYTLPMGKKASRKSTGCEIRYVPEKHQSLVRLSASENVKINIHQGDFWIGSAQLEAGKVHEISIDLRDRLLDLPSEVLKDCLFSPKVARVIVEGGSVNFHGLDTYGGAYRKPDASELPAKRWLAWGSSITHCDTYGYIFQAASRLRVDVLDKGLSGSCGAEPVVADYLVNDNSWDFATCEWGVNMRGSVTVEEFNERISQSLEIFLKAEKPVFIMTAFPNDAHVGLAGDELNHNQLGFDDCIRKLYQSKKASNPNLYLIEGSDVMRLWNWMVGDLVHPSHQGHSHMGEQLAKYINTELKLV